MSMASSSSKLTLKLIIDSKREKVLFAEASKAVVDFLFYLLCLPVGSATRILNQDQMVGSLVNLYESVKNLDETYMEPKLRKDLMLKLIASVSSQISGLLPSIDDTSSDTSKYVFYRCPTHCGYVTCDNTTRCPYQCGNTMNSVMQFVGEKVGSFEISVDKSGGFVKEVVTYMVMDDLVVQPMSSISSITLLNKFNVKEVGALQEKVVDLDMNKVCYICL
ncbi:hypothetical protein DEO72_LG9g3811 [Vigna unguiculata]|uniref:DUF674 domain-containing protein n=1 Tax=Vigna unguiculata TaxID=3917 RepID=A0A4D6N7E1_VIGUN|nr:hypothetical protein DEO72_LG9g3811 [Vigna unguiculata]